MVNALKTGRVQCTTICFGSMKLNWSIWMQVASVTVILLMHLTFCFSLASAQDTNRINSEISTKSKIAPGAEVSWDSLFQHSLNLLYTDPDSARVIIQEAFSLNLFENPVQKVRSTNLLGATHHLQANYVKALEYYYEALPLAVELNDIKRIADIYNNVGSVNLKIGNYKEALNSFLKATNFYSELGLIDSKASVLNNIGLLYMDIDNFEKARFHFRKAYFGFEIKDDSIGMAATLSNIGSLFSNNENIDSAFFYINHAIDINTRIQNKYGLCIALQAKANTLFEYNYNEEAVECYLESKRIAELIDHTYQQAFTHIGLAKSYLKTGKTDHAIQHATEAMDIASETNNNKLKQETHAVFSDIYEQIGNYRKAFEHYRTSITLKDELINQTKLHQIYNLEIEQLSLAKEIQQLEILRQEFLLSQKNNVIIFIIAVFILILAGLYLLYFNYKHRRNATLQKTILNLTEKKSRAALEAEILERKRIGQELHDGLGQMLSVARLNISVLQQKAFLSEQRKNELLDAVMNSVDQAFYELRDISHNLAPSVLAEKGFGDALKELADQINQSKHIEVQLEMYGLNSELDAIIENTLYRAAQELLNNAIKHAHATTFFLQIVKSEKEITLMVEDNGKGFEMDDTLIISGGGLYNLRSRVENINGNIFIDAMENRGTIVTIVISLNNNELIKP